MCIQGVSERCRPTLGMSSTYQNEKESVALKSLKNNKEIRILQADKGNCTVMLNESTYAQKISSLLESGVYEILRKDPTSQIERKIRKLLTKHKIVVPAALKHKPTPITQIN
jgi:hypothetical protein